jgi:prepilin-type N-terminal cleavage/methylation domain-containing protein/prepilin-type processing-associated H-X9-DG protein
MQQEQHHKRGRHGFTLVELLVVIAIVALLAAILFPVFATAREKARQITCLSNQRQLAQAFLCYAQDYDETLPYFGDRWPSPRVYWTELIQPYLRNDRVLECPSWPKEGKYRNKRGQLVAGKYGFGVNYGLLFTYLVLNGQPYVAPTRLAGVNNPAGTLLTTDSQGSHYVYSPLLFPLNTDWDGDGLRDSHGAKLWVEGPYNRGDPRRHSEGSNCTFLDGHARWIHAHDWLTNRGDMWGSTLLREEL